MIVVPMPGKRFWNAVPACVLLTKNFRNGVPVRSVTKILLTVYINTSRSQWPGGVKRRSAAAWLLGSRVRIPLRHGCLSVVSICCVVLCR
jgi:hypothetical protein